MKLFIFSVLMIFGMGNVMGQYEIAVKNDSGVWVYNAYGLHNSSANYKHPSISAIGGDTVFTRIVDTTGNTVTIDYWLVQNINTPSIFDTIYSDTLSYILVSDVTLGRWIKAYKDFGFGLEEIGANIIFAKFSPPALNLATVPPALKATNTSDTLTLSDFDIVVNTSWGGYNAHCDSIYWYRDTVMVYAGTDTSYIATVSGDYSIKAKLVYVTRLVYDSIVDTCRFECYQWSNTVTITIDTVTTDVSEFSNDVKLRIYPNPTSDCLYISDEVEYTIYSISGKEALKGWGNKVDVGDLEPGVYFLRAVDGKSVKFIVN